MSQYAHPSSRTRHESHEDERTRVKALERQERHAAQRSLIRALRTMVQPHEPHHYHAAAVDPISPRRAYGSPADPGGEDNTGFCPKGIC
jgi:hypothetical protein